MKTPKEKLKEIIEKVKENWNKEQLAKEWTATILSLNWGEDKEVHYEYKLGGLNSPTEAYEAAIEYSLKNLIKKFK